MYLIQRQMYLRVYYGLLMSIIIQMSRFSSWLGPPRVKHTTAQNMALKLFCLDFKCFKCQMLNVQALTT